MTNTLHIEIDGTTNVMAQLDRIARGVIQIMNTKVTVGSRLPYAWGQETGRHRVSGKLARKAGPTWYLKTGFLAVQNQADLDVTNGLKKIPYPGPWILIRLGRWIKRIAQSMAPIGNAYGPNEREDPHPGKLRKSMRVVANGRNIR